MKTKLKKNLLGRDKSVQKLHNDSKKWVSKINFVNDEMRFLEHLLSSNYIDCLDKGLFKKIEVLVLQISDEKTAGKSLMELINNHEEILADLIKHDSAESNKIYLQTHKNIGKEIYSFTKKYKKIKQEIFNIVENVMKQKEQKKLI